LSVVCFRLIVRIPLYNKIRNLKRKLAATSKLLQGKSQKPVAKKTKNDSFMDSQSSQRSESSTISGSNLTPDCQQVNEDNVQDATTSSDQPVELTSPIKAQNDAFQFMRDNAVSPTKNTGIAKELTALNTLALQVAAAPKKVRVQLLQRKQGVVYPKCANYLAKKLGVNRRRVLHKPLKAKLAHRREREKIKSVVIKFLTRSDNSITLPSKKDATSQGMQRYALNDTITNIYNKFTVEYQDIRISRATFAKIRPK
jgi:hypothetical protein